MIDRDDHHSPHDRISWEARKEGYYIRNHLIARNMARTVHNLLHIDCSPVPVPLYPSLQYVARHFLPTGDILKDIDAVSLLLEAANRQPSAKPIEKEINLYTAEALQDQVPYIHEGQPSNMTYIDLGAYSGK